MDTTRRYSTFQPEPSPMNSLSRRSLLLAVAACALSRAFVPAFAQAPRRALVHRDMRCGCCGAWAQRLEAAGFATQIVNEPDMTAIKARLGVPAALVSCHTAEVEGYVVEGHVPLAAIERLLKERPQATGIAVGGMPMGSPGMEMGGDADVYEVTLFGPAGQRSYGVFQGDKAI
jgi:hypothetical protein